MATRMDLGGYTTWRCQGCTSHGNHPKAGPAQQHADQTGHNVLVTETQIHLEFPEGQPPVPIEMRPGTVDQPGHDGRMIHRVDQAPRFIPSPEASAALAEIEAHPERLD